MPETDLWGAEVLTTAEGAALMRALTGRAYYTMPELAARPIDHDSWRSVLAHLVSLNEDPLANVEDEPEITTDSRSADLPWQHDAYDNDRSGYWYGNCDIVQCEGCDRFTIHYNWIDADETRFCVPCYEDEAESCEGCGASWSTVRGAEQCCERFICPGCDRYYFSESDADECCYSEDGDDYDSDSDDDSGRLVHDYNFKPHAILHRSALEIDARNTPTHYYGVEIEIEQANGNRVSELASILEDSGENHHYLKHDGSIDNGVELVTHPHSLLAWQDSQGYVGELATILSRAGSNGARAWNAPRCGLHVHVTRTAFRSEAHLYRFTKLAEDNAGTFSRFAGRHSEQWASFDAHKRGSKRIDAVKRPGSRGFNPGARYMAVNLSNRHTVELRFYRPSLKIQSVVAAVELVDAMIAYTRRMTTNDVITHDALAWSPFALFVTLNASTYPQAADKIATRVGAPTPETAAE